MSDSTQHFRGADKAKTFLEGDDETQHSSPSVEAAPAVRSLADIGQRLFSSKADERRPKPVEPSFSLIGGKKRRLEYERDLQAWNDEAVEYFVQSGNFGRMMAALVANWKGGVLKSPTTIILAHAMSALRQDGGVAAVEVADERGTLLRRAQGEPTQGLSEMLEAAAVEGKLSTRAAVDSYGARQTSGAMVFGSVGDRMPFNASSVDVLHDIFSEHLSTIILDSANMARSKAFLASFALADAIVVPSLVTPDSLIAALQIIDAIRTKDQYEKIPFRPELSDRAFVILSHHEENLDEKMLARSREALKLANVSFVEVPFDEHIKGGGPIVWERLSPASQRAWKLAAAELTRVFAHAIAESTPQGK